LIRARLALILLASAWPLPADARPDEHLLRGAKAFQAARFEEALVELEVAERAGAAQAAWYVAATLQRLGRTEEALTVFARAERVAPSARDEVLDYYLALAYYDAHLFLLADVILERVALRAGPKIAGQALKIRADVKRLFESEPSADNIDAYLIRAASAERRGLHAVAVLYYDEAAALSQKRQKPHRMEEAIEGRARAAKNAERGGEGTR
jgi:tetratricopeptide (TPR) repeat protein